MNNTLRQLINEVLNEKLILKRHEDRLVVVSDLSQRSEQSKETFTNKNKLKDAGFRWDSQLNSWATTREHLPQAQAALNKINKIEMFIEEFNDLQEFIASTDNLSKKDELSQRLNGFLKNLEQDLDETAASEEIKKFLDFQAKLRKRSAYNTMLIWIQKRNATHVEGFRTWQEKFGRQVKKGAKAITIFAPRTPAKPKEDPADKDNEEDVDGEIKKQNVHYFIPVSVFDVTDTEPIPGKEHLMVDEPDWHDANEPNETADKLYEYVEQAAKEMGINLTRDVSGRGEQGYAAGGHINLSSDIAGVNRCATMVHEFAHELLHFKKESIFYVDAPLSKADKEVQAESVSYVVMKHYDLPVKHQPVYLAVWKTNKDALNKHLGVIKKVADFIITKIDEIAAEKQTGQPTAALEQK
jgi:hypothetical protein